MSKYYRIHDKNLIGRQDGMFDCYIYNIKIGWEPDNEKILMDRIIGYDEDRIGSSDVMSMIEEITEEEANKLISNMQ